MITHRVALANLQPRLLLRITSVHHLSNKGIDAKLTDEEEVHVLISGEELRDDVKIGILDSSSIHHSDANFERGRVAVVESETIKHARQELAVGGHVVPEPRIVRSALAVPELDTVAPNDDLTTEIGLGGLIGKVGKGVSVPDPAVVGKGKRGWIVFLGRRVRRKSSEVAANHRRSDTLM